MTQDLATRGGTDITRGIQVDQAAVLKHLGLDANDPAAQALVLTCQRYDLDPILKHALLIEKRLYVTRDGLLHVAHKNGQLDGIEVLEQAESETHYIAKVAVYRKDMSHPFVYVGRYPKTGTNKKFGPEMAVKCAEAMALKRAFDVSVTAADEMWDRGDIQEAAAAPAAPESVGGAATGNGADPVEAVTPVTAASRATRTPPESSDEPPLAGDRPCPDCGYEVAPTNSTNDKAPKWRCSNASCTAHFNKQKDAHEPWVSWSTNPWKPGGEVDTLIAESTKDSDDNVEPGSTAANVPAESAATTEPTPSGAPASSSVEGGGDQTTGSAAQESLSTPLDGDREELAGLIVAAIEDKKNRKVTLSAAIRASMGPCSRHDHDKPPTNKADFATLPAPVLSEIVESLSLKVGASA